MLGADGALLGTVSVEVEEANPGADVHTGGLLCDLLMHGTGLGMPRSAAPGDAIPSPVSSCVVAPGVAGLPLPGLPAFHPCLSIRGGWRTTQSLRVSRSSSWRGCCKDAGLGGSEPLASDLG
jgi:hypothetical protein